MRHFKLMLVLCAAIGPPLLAFQIIDHLEERAWQKQQTAFYVRHWAGVPARVVADGEGIYFYPVVSCPIPPPCAPPTPEELRRQLVDAASEVGWTCGPAQLPPRRRWR